VAHAGEALRDDAVNACLACRGQEGIGALGPEPVGLGECPVHLPAELHSRQRGRLVDDRVWVSFEDGLAHGFPIEEVEGDCFGAERREPRRLLARPCSAEHLVPCVYELNNESGADRAARACDEDSHLDLLVTSGRFQGSTGKTPSGEGM
jgi:hypothetical protein